MPIGRALFWCATLGALALGVRSALGAPPPLWLAVSMTLAYVGLIVVATLVPRLEIFGDVVWRVPEARGQIALTFDDGPSPRTTERVLSVLRERGQKATFFVIGRKAEAHPELLRAMVEDGHSIGVHGYDHDRMYAFWQPGRVSSDVERCIRIVEQATGQRPVFFRPPIGQASPRTFAGAKKAGVEIVGWSLRGRDGLRGTAPARIVERVQRGARAGTIVLLHDAAEREDFEPAGVTALQAVLDELERRGLSSVTVDELLKSA